MAGDPAEDVLLLRGDPAVAELARRRAEVVAGYARAASGLGWHERVIPLLEGLARAEPLNERAHARLMVALAGPDTRPRPSRSTRTYGGGLMKSWGSIPARS